MEIEADRKSFHFRIASFGTAASGAVALNFAVGAIMLFSVMGLAVDYGTLHSAKTNLQSAADAGALAAAKEMGLADAKVENVAAIVKAVVEKYVGANVGSDNYGSGIVIQTSVTSDPFEVSVTATENVEVPFGFDPGVLGSTVTANSVARIVGKPNICVLGLDPSENGTISLEQHALVTGLDCAVFSNSSHTSSIKAKNSATLTASLICSRGGKSGGPGNFTPEPLTDCPSFDDPLADRPEPSVGICSATNLVITGGSQILFPGTYCGGLKMTAGADIALNPGIYVIKDGPLTVDGGSKIAGEFVGFFFTGAGAVFNFAAASTVELSAPEDGPMAGLLMFEARTQAKTGIHKITSNDARKLLGTIYLSRSELRVDSDSSVADQSAYTAIVSRAMRLYGGPHLVLNTNYNATTIPVPAGIRGTSQPIALVK